jgi:hypothetical protein
MGTPGRAWAAAGCAILALLAIDLLVNRGQPGDAARYPPVLHRWNIPTPHGRPIQEIRPDSQAAYHNEVIAMTAEREPAHPHSGWALTALRRAISVLRYVEDENMRASEAICRSIGAPHPPPAGRRARRLVWSRSFHH